MKKRTFLYASIVLCCATLLKANAQEVDFSKMSKLMRTVVTKTMQQKDNAAVQKGLHKTMDFNYNAIENEQSICAFVKVTGNGDEILRRQGCRNLATFGNIHIADIPLKAIAPLSMQNEVVRIEASESRTINLDTTLVIVNDRQLHSAEGLPQAYTGHGVVMGIMDVGFDVTSPNFYDTALTHTRIQRFWDQLSPDSASSTLYVGADYRTENEILEYSRSHDGMIETHGTHTLGIAAGTGYDTGFRGMAYGADICIVSNAVNTDLPLIPKEQLYKYTSATDVLGFKYIFDYATEVGKPCVISFSESSIQSMDNDEELFQQVLEQMTGPGRIIVASAGNQGLKQTYLHKPKETERDGMFINNENITASFSLSTDGPFTCCIKAYGNDGTTQSIDIASKQIVQAADSIMEDSVNFFGKILKYKIYAYQTYFSSALTGYDIVMKMDGGIGTEVPLSFEVEGNDADIKIYSNSMNFYSDSRDISLSGGERRSSIGSPACAPPVICVGATAWRNHCVNYEGTPLIFDCGMEGAVASYSSTGPTRDELVKPDVVAPGTFVVSSESSFYAEENQETAKKEIVSFSEFNGRKYPWASFVGTSMSAPVVGGVIAQWLEANPNLTKDDIMRIFSKTCHKKQHGETDSGQGTAQEKDNQWGYGEIDAYAGLLNILGLDNIKGITAYQPTTLNVSCHNGLLEIALADNSHAASGQNIKGNGIKATISVFSITGKKELNRTLTLTHSPQTISLKQLPKGIYLIQTATKESGCSGSFIVRLE